jgi:hypothetical protein
VMWSAWDSRIDRIKKRPGKEEFDAISVHPGQDMNDRPIAFRERRQRGASARTRPCRRPTPTGHAPWSEDMMVVVKRRLRG